ncbi:MAG: 50S ribosomal protein L13 [Candidatus Muirbacterium halophilum]|nr:50S ribosomal protein L13 [Candidatus Muirbacterium halophilum]MCK9475039.1 50S ribosomal protein L13 [Candidatus Muirbacterium halophilum]
MNNKTFLLKKEEVKRKWHIVDAQDKTLGRLSQSIARVLIGKHKVTYTPHTDDGDFVIVLNADKITLTGNKVLQKEYFTHSMYPGGCKIVPFKTMLEKQPDRIVRHAVSGMLPKNKLRKHRLTRLKVYTGVEHGHQAQKPENLEI